MTVDIEQIKREVQDVFTEEHRYIVGMAVITFAGFPSIGKSFHKKEEAENFVKEMTQ